MSSPFSPTFVTRLGMVFVAPRWALSIAGDRRAPGRSGSDLIRVIGLALLVGYLHVFVVGVWTAVALGTFSVSPLTMALASGLVIPLAALIAAAVMLWALAGRARNFGRALDLASVAAVPLVLLLFSSVAISAVVHSGGTAILGAVSLGLSFAAFGALIALAMPMARISVSVPAVPPEAVTRQGRRAGRVVLALLGLLAAAQVAWMAMNPDDVRPVLPSAPAPALALPEIGPGGALGARVTFTPSTHGRPAVLDFWATWCGPCLRGLPHLEAFRVAHPEVDVISINLDDAKAARALFASQGYTMRLLYDDAGVATRYGVMSLPHVVVIDRHGVVREVGRSVPRDVASLLR